MKRTRIVVFIMQILVSTIICGCASTGAKISSSQVSDMRQSLQQQSIDYFAEQLLRVEKVRLQVGRHLPGKETDHEIAVPFLYVDNNDKIIQHFSTAGLKGVIYLGALQAEPELGSLKRGDEILVLNGKWISDSKSLRKMIAQLAGESQAEFTFRRQFRVWKQAVPLIKYPPVPPILLDGRGVASVFRGDEGGFIYMTCSFFHNVENDDEFALLIAFQSQILSGRSNFFGSRDWLSVRHRITPANLLKEYLGEEDRLNLAPINSIAEVSASFTSGVDKEAVFEADRISLQAVRDAGYDPEKAIDFWFREAADKKTNLLAIFAGLAVPVHERLAVLQQSLGNLAASSEGLERSETQFSATGTHEPLA